MAPRRALGLIARANAEIGTLFTTLVLVTGSLWGRPVWGAWWAWDARMTTTLILWFIYVGYLLLRSYTGRSEGGARTAAVLGIVGFVDVPIDYLSITWWRTQHPAPQSRSVVSRRPRPPSGRRCCSRCSPSRCCTPSC